MDAVALHPTANTELKASIKRGGARVDLCVSNIVKEIEKANVILAPNGLFVTEDTMRSTTYDLCDVFILGAELEAKRRYESDLEKAARAAEVSKAKEADDFLAGGSDNVYTQELGLINGEEKTRTHGEAKS
jgi:hypothetical protein